MPTDDRVVWTDFYTKFPYCSPDAVRPGCEPRVMLHTTPAEDAIVLVHGLTDSPHFVSAIAKHFFEELRYDVYMPLLHRHGLKDITTMEGVKLDYWKENVGYAVECASTRSPRVSIGGLSTGGTLSFWAAATDDRINGAVYLFSAALDIAGGRYGVLGDLKEWLGRVPIFIKLLERRDLPLIGANPFRYHRMDYYGAHQLMTLIRETDALIAAFKQNKLLGNPFAKPVFAAHSEVDTTANIDGIYALRTASDASRFATFFIEPDMQVSHASLVLRDPVRAVSEAGRLGKLLELANPVFDDMMVELNAFATGVGA
jgi:pimeloyl-ACP methyl ester carboxylesterase